MSLQLFVQGLIVLAAIYLAPGFLFTEQFSYWGFLAFGIAGVAWTYYRGRHGRGPIW